MDGVIINASIDYIKHWHLDRQAVVGIKKWKECGLKIQYRNKKRATNCLNKIRKRGLIVPNNAHAYLCPQCSYWHLGHKRRKE